jgi:translation initiation factor 2B subunit (eIF-2B alpha/beta/delta family)
MGIIDPGIAGKIDEFKNDHVHGAGWLSRLAISILTQAITQSHAGNTADLMKEIAALANDISRTKPGMVSISNYVHQFLKEVGLAAQSVKNVETLRMLAAATGKELIKLSEDAANLASTYGGRIISNLDTVITCSYSSTVCMALELARLDKTKFRVLVAESKSNDEAFGRFTAEQLKEHRIPVEVIADKSIGKRISDADKAIVGADSILADGSLINGTPTLALAQAAREANIPFFAICETAKFDTQGSINKATAPEAGFDMVPPDLITGIIMENGIMQTNLIPAYIEEKKTT